MLEGSFQKTIPKRSTISSAVSLGRTLRNLNSDDGEGVACEQDCISSCIIEIKLTLTKKNLKN